MNDKRIKSPSKRKKVILSILMICLLGVFLYTSISILLNQVDAYNNKKDSDSLIDEVINTPNEVPEEVKIDFQKLLSENDNTKGWIKFNDDYINYPIVQGKDNTYYLTRGFNKKSNSMGAIYMDFRNKSWDDDNVVIYGHSTNDKSMFGSLEDVFKKSFFDKEDADLIYIYDVDNNLVKYQIFSYYTIEAEDYYITPSFKTQKEFNKFIKTIKGRSFGKRDVEVSSEDKILTLSTCAGARGTTKRRVIHAKRIFD